MVNKGHPVSHPVQVIPAVFSYYLTPRSTLSPSSPPSAFSRMSPRSCYLELILYSSPLSLVARICDRLQSGTICTRGHHPPTYEALLGTAAHKKGDRKKRDRLKAKVGGNKTKKTKRSLKKKDKTVGDEKIESLVKEVKKK